MPAGKHMPMPSGTPSKVGQTLRQSTVLNDRREAKSAPVPTGVRAQTGNGEKWSMTQQSSKKVD